jgi:hypothetical protein
MPKPRTSVSGDNALREFYEACGLEPKIIEGAIRQRYQQPPKTNDRESEIAKRLRGERIPPKIRRAKKNQMPANTS